MWNQPGTTWEPLPSMMFPVRVYSPLALLFAVKRFPRTRLAMNDSPVVVVVDEQSEIDSTRK